MRLVTPTKEYEALRERYTRFQVAMDEVALLEGRLIDAKTALTKARREWTELPFMQSEQAILSFGRLMGWEE